MQIEDFENEYNAALADAWSTDVEQVPEDVEPPPVDLMAEGLSLADVDKRLRALRYWNQQLFYVDDLVEQEMHRIGIWQQRQTERIRKRMRWNEEALRLYMEAQGLKTLDLPSGTLRMRAGRDRVDVVLPETFIDWAEKSGHEDLVRVKKDVDKTATMAYVKKTGEEPPGIEVKRGDDSFTYDLK